MHRSYPFGSHPCWSNDHSLVWERIHLPVAPRCNVKCIYCNHNGGTSCHLPLPGNASRVYGVEEAINRLEIELAQRPNLKIVAVSGPGEPLFNPQTIQVFEAATRLDNHLEFCLSTNGILLEKYVEKLAKIGVHTVTVTINAVHPETVERVYEWVRFGHERLFQGFGMDVITRQLEGIRAATNKGIHIKVNTVLLPEINGGEIGNLAKTIVRAGAEFHNIMPVISCSSLKKLRSPSNSELTKARTIALQYIPQFHICKQCRSDVVGIPGNDLIL